jgi:hypothetical protein
VPEFAIYLKAVSNFVFKTIQMQFLDQHLHTKSLVNILKPGSISSHENGLVIYLREKEFIGLTFDQLKLMNNLEWIKPYTKEGEDYTSEQALVAIQAEFPMAVKKNPGHRRAVLH